MQIYLAIDIGASSGRHILGCVENGRIRTKEIYRFPNKAVLKNGHLCWDLESLWDHILEGMHQCKEYGLIPGSVGVDTWGTDFVLLDSENKVLGDAVAYRDARTAGMDAVVEEQMDPETLYKRTGIQKQIFNTIYQLTALKQQSPELLAHAARFLMIPDYFHFRMTGVQTNEYTNASTTQLVKAGETAWDRGLIRQLGFPDAVFGDVSMPGTLLGGLTPEVCERVGFNCRVVLPATHDTGSAVLAVPAAGEKNFLYISSGTWSLLGTENPDVCTTPAARAANFTNEGGYEKRYRFLKNIMGSWMIQSVRNENGKKQTFDELCGLAEKAKNFPSLLDVNDPSFLAPESMAGAIREYCRRSGQAVPQTLGEVMSCIYRSLARSYAETVRQMEEVTGRRFSGLYIVGGGSKDWYLNRLTAQAVGLPVFAGPAEATAVGNLLAQMLYEKEFSNVAEARACVRRSFEIRKVEK
ncbi:MAG: rhamnulokinase [Oscillospiraceae bacterium]|jgi:rhamnulokinase|nr:rhamnulokinase [Oscillospiraceae bacterium]